MRLLLASLLLLAACGDETAPTSTDAAVDPGTAAEAAPNDGVADAEPPKDAPAPVPPTRTLLLGGAPFVFGGGPEALPAGYTLGRDEGQGFVRACPEREAACARFRGNVLEAMEFVYNGTDATEGCYTAPGFREGVKPLMAAAGLTAKDVACVNAGGRGGACPAGGGRASAKDAQTRVYALAGSAEYTADLEVFSDHDGIPVTCALVVRAR